MRPYRRRHSKGRGQRDEEECTDPMRGRPLKEIHIDDFPKVTEISPSPIQSEEIIHLTIGEYEALRLVDQQRYNQEEAGRSMNVSRGTIWRLLDSGRAKLINVLIEGKKLIIEKIEEK